MSLTIELELEPADVLDALREADALPAELDKYEMYSPSLVYFRALSLDEDGGLVSGVRLVAVFE